MDRFFKPTPLLKSVGSSKPKIKELKITNISQYLNDLKKYTETNPISTPKTTDLQSTTTIEDEPHKSKKDKNSSRLAHQWLPKPQYTNVQSTLIIFNLPKDITQTKLTEEFTRYGPIQRIQLIKNHSGKLKGYAFITFLDVEHCAHCVDEIQRTSGLVISGRLCNVDYVRGGIDNYFQPKWVMGRRQYREFHRDDGYFKPPHRVDHRNNRRNFADHVDGRQNAPERSTLVSYRSRDRRTT